jgi:predicted amidohydrolase YtcJ
LPGASGSHHGRQRGDPAGLLIAAPNAAILYQTLAKAPLLGDAERSTRHFLRELNRFAVTSAIDPAGEFESFPVNYQTVTTLAERGELTVRDRLPPVPADRGAGGGGPAPAGGHGLAWRRMSGCARTVRGRT